jgi:ParB/RepB/Spo0J family partition protein
MKKNGLLEAIEILPDGTIVKGHRRTAAAKYNGWPCIDVVVRHDLVGKEQKIEEEFLKDNYLRRQLSPLQRARCAQRLMELAKGGKLTASEKEQLKEKSRDKVARLLNLSGRHVDRLLRILKAPLEVQRAFDAGKLSGDLAQKVEGMDEEDQKKIAEEIRKRGVQHAKAIVEQFLPPKAETRKGADQLYTDIVRALHAAGKEKLVDNVDKLGRCLRGDAARLDEGIELLRRLKEESRRIQAEDALFEEEEEACSDGDDIVSSFKVTDGEVDIVSTLRDLA